MPHSDIDECLEELDGCDQICTNTDGSYDCTCMDGYELESDNHTCTGDDYMHLLHRLLCTYVTGFAKTVPNGTRIEILRIYIAWHES